MVNKRIGKSAGWQNLCNCSSLNPICDNDFQQQTATQNLIRFLKKFNLNCRIVHFLLLSVFMCWMSTGNASHRSRHMWGFFSLLFLTHRGAERAADNFLGHLFECGFILTLHFIVCLAELPIFFRLSTSKPIQVSNPGFI